MWDRRTAGPVIDGPAILEARIFSFARTAGAGVVVFRSRSGFLLNKIFCGRPLRRLANVPGTEAVPPPSPSHLNLL